jgi:hypothetical protein
MTVAQILSALAEGPSRIADYTSGLTRAQLHTAPGAGEWSANEVLAHLRSCADVWGDCIATILQQEIQQSALSTPGDGFRKQTILNRNFGPP